jgi:hypothetical protein
MIVGWTAGPCKAGCELESKLRCREGDVSATPASAIETRPPRRRGWGQYSLVSLLLLAVIGCLVGGYIAEMRRRQAAEALVREKDAEIRQNRIDLGLLDDQPNVLTITDPTKVHIRQLPSYDPTESWRWRVYLPPGKSWSLFKTQGKFWDTARKQFGESVLASELDQSGEFTLEGNLQRGSEGKAMLLLKWGKFGSSMPIPDAGIDILKAQGNRTFAIAGAKAQATFSPEERIELLRWQVEIEEDQPISEDATLPGHREPAQAFGIGIKLQRNSR